MSRSTTTLARLDRMDIHLVADMADVEIRGFPRHDYERAWTAFALSEEMDEVVGCIEAMSDVDLYMAVRCNEVPLAMHLTLDDLVGMAPEEIAATSCPIDLVRFPRQAFADAYEVLRSLLPDAVAAAIRPAFGASDAEIVRTLLDHGFPLPDCPAPRPH